MNKIPPRHSPRRNQGVALILVLCFVVLITGLVIAYFSRVLTTQQLANASTSTTQAEMLANSATDTILGDLKQETADTTVASIASTPPPAALPAGVTVYVPTKAIYAVPQRNVSPKPSPATASSPSVEPIPNLVRRSLNGDKGVTPDNYVPAPAVTSRASAANSATASVNGRSVSTARWNRHYLIPTAASAGPAGSSTASKPVADFTAPDWVFVTAEKGPDVLSSPTKDSGSSTVTVTGRYAYAIYDEGGLLDINHTGYPSVSTLSHIGAKPAPSYADLTQLGMLATDVDHLLGWRDYATLQSTGTFPGLQPSVSLADTAYYNLFVSNPASILQVPLTVWNNGTDQRFLSRQQLISFFAATNLDTKYLQYFGTFNRGLNQPSYVPETNRLKVLPSGSGGNNAGDDPTNNPSTNITPNFLTARVVNTFTRFDGTQSSVGEPLVKKRFPLNRLAWLTFRGPVADDSGNLNPTGDAGVAAEITAYNNAGIPNDFLKHGTPTNVFLYFGLQWGPKPNDPTTKLWSYRHGSNVTSGAILNVINPTKPTDVARQSPGREPDFFELLKASINPGSIAKSSLSPGILADSNASALHAAQNQSIADSSLDAAILQIGANIIDQFDADSYPTQISYSFSGNTGDSGTVYGDENLPYISRVRSSLIRVVEAVPLESASDSTSNALPITNTGVAALMNFPEIWNPHDWSSNNPAQSVGVAGPVKFKIYATTNVSNGLTPSTSVCVWDPSGRYSCDADWVATKDTPSKSPGFTTMYHFPSFGTPGSNAGPEARVLSEPNTRMTFSFDPSLFREPTILFKPGIPKNSLLAAPALVPSNGEIGGVDGLGYIALNTSFFGASGGLISAAGSSLGTVGLPAVGDVYVGFYLGAHPLRWYDKGTQQSTVAVQTQYSPVNDVVYTLACEDGNGGWIPYDNKAVTTKGEPNANLNTGSDVGFGLNGTASTSGSALDYGLRYFETVDPRSSRFGMLDPWVFNNATSIPPRQVYSSVNLAQGTIKTTRDSTSSGTAFFVNPGSNSPSALSYLFLASMGWYHDANLAADNSLRPGLLSQNNPGVTPDGNVSTGLLPDGTNVSGTFAPFYYADADGVVRRASGGNVPGGSGSPASSTVGLQTASANATSANNSTGTSAHQIDSRPVVLNRPFLSVAELGYVYSGTPWKNLDFFLPESGDAAMLDVFCVNDNSDARGMTAGQVNLNTHQVPVLQAILAQTNKDQWNNTGTPATAILGGTDPSAQAQQIAQLLVTRTVTGPAKGPNLNNGPQPLQNISDLVGRWVKEVDLPAVGGSNATSTAGINGQASCDGFTTDLANVAAPPNDPTHNIQRFSEGAIRALANGGQTRVWNLMFDIVAQTGRFIPQAATLDQFNVEGEQHYWVHVAIDRYTGQVLDKQVEVVKE